MREEERVSAQDAGVNEGASSCGEAAVLNPARKGSGNSLVSMRQEYRGKCWRECANGRVSEQNVGVNARWQQYPRELLALMRAVPMLA